MEMQIRVTAPSGLTRDLEFDPDILWDDFVKTITSNMAGSVAGYVNSELEEYDRAVKEAKELSETVWDVLSKFPYSDVPTPETEEQGLLYREHRTRLNTYGVRVFNEGGVWKFFRRAKDDEVAGKIRAGENLSKLVRKVTVQIGKEMITCTSAVGDETFVPAVARLIKETREDVRNGKLPAKKKTKKRKPIK